MDDRVKNNLSNWVGLPVEQKMQLPYLLQSSTRRTDEPYNRFVLHRNIESRGIFATCIPRLYDKLNIILKSLSCFELFSSFGMSEVRSALTEDEAQVLGQGFGYAIMSINDFIPAIHDYKIQLSEDRSDISLNLPKKFCCIIDNKEVSFAKAYIRDSSGLVAIDVETQNDFRGKGIGSAVVSEATKWLLLNGHAVYYGANIRNVSSLHIAKKLGFQLMSQHIVA